MDDATRPTLRLKPKADARRLRHGYPWVHLDDLVADRRTRAIPPGTVAELQDAERTPLALATVNMGAKVAARVLDRDVSAR
ncbi:MAG: RlmI/RlmK family 23S rRNA methyltransferase, partial [Pseudomonadota bacterium]